MPGFLRLSRDRGFTLIEVLIAFVIAALALGALVRRPRGQSVPRTPPAAPTRRWLGRSHTSPCCPGTVLADLDREGDEGDGFHWRIHVAADGVVAPGRQFISIPPGTVTLYRVAVVVSWSERGRSRAVELDSVRLGPVS